MAFEIETNDLTNADTLNGTGVFDLLMKSASAHIIEQYENSRITDTDYASVYLGAMERVLQNSVQFLLQKDKSEQEAILMSEKVKSEVKNNEDGGILDLSKQKLQEEIDLVIAQTALQYENVDASKQDTSRKNLLNSKEVILKEKQTALVERQESEMELNGVKERLLTDEKTIATRTGALDNTNKVNAEVAYINTQDDELKLNGASKRTLEESENLLIQERILLTAEEVLKVKEDVKVATETVNKLKQEILMLTAQTAEIAPNGVADREIKAEQVLKLKEEILLIEAQKDEVAPNALSERNVQAEQILKLKEEVKVLSAREAETLAATTRQDAESVEKIALMQAQAKGFKTDAKNKLLKLMYEGYAVNTTTAGEIPANSPSSSFGPAIDSLTNSIIADS